MSNTFIGNNIGNELEELDAEWESFLNDDFKNSKENVTLKSLENKKKIDPRKSCSDLYISTKTKITYECLLSLSAKLGENFGFAYSARAARRQFGILCA